MENGNVFHAKTFIDATYEGDLMAKAGVKYMVGRESNARFGETRREVGSSVHGRELNDLAFSLCGDILVEVSVGTNAALARLVQGLVERGGLRLRDGVSAEKVGRLLGDGARGVNQARPSIPNHLFAQHYREIAEAILFGCAAG